MDFGAFVEILPKKDGMVHISELAPWRVEKVTDVVSVGKEVQVKVMEIDSMGRVNLSMKQVQENYPNGMADAPAGATASTGGGGARPPRRPFGNKPPRRPF